ncbi:MAG: glycosyltransferase family 2 protein [Bacillus sp. (in: Bacteria)]|nr:glycosyltransferase family 2 protein [Bacillus sp. (in: firmicutes)]
MKKLLSPSKKHIIERFHKSDVRLYSIGFIKKELQELEEFQRSKDSFKRRMATWRLIKWYVNQSTKESAVKGLKLITELRRNRGNIPLFKVVILEAECLQRLGKISEAKAVVKNIKQSELNVELYFCLANLEEMPDRRISIINEMLNSLKLSLISYKTGTDVKPIHRLQGNRDSATVNNNIEANQHKVSVILTTYNAEDGIKTALDSLLTQTWSNMEVLVADGGSTDSTTEILKDFEQKDKRIKLINSKQGPYYSRNEALKQALGDFITVSTTNEWSHPQKIERQVKQLIESPEIIGNTSQYVWVSSELDFYRQKDASEFICDNLTSFMFRRKKVLDSIGYWDNVLFGADYEFIDRIKLKFGEQSVVNLRQAPLTFKTKFNGYVNEFELSSSNGFMIGPLKEYWESYSYFS